MSARRTRTGGAPDALTVRLAYGRVSSREQADEGLSLANQFRRCRLYNAELPHSIAGEEFCDVASGRNDDRAEYQKMLLVIRGLVAAGKTVSVTVLRLDRLGRSAKERLRIWEELDKAGVEMHAVMDGGIQHNKLVYTILAGVAEDEAQRIGDRVCDIWEALEVAGWHKPGRVAWGYRWRRATADETAAGAPKSVLEPDDGDAEQIGTADAAREMWTRYAGGEALEPVLRWIAALPDAARGGRRLMGSGVRTLLRSPVYIGRIGGPHDIKACVEQGESCEALERPRGRWAALVDDTTWLRAHEQYRSSKRLPAQASGEYLLTGLLRCASCGGRMVGNPGNRARATRDGVTDLTTQRRYLCSSRLHGDVAARTAPCYATVLARKIETAVLDVVVELVEHAVARAAHPRVEAALAEGAGRAARAQANEGAGRQIGEYRKQLTEAKHLLAETTQRFFRGDITKLAYDVTAELATQQIEGAERGIAELSGQRRRSTVLPVEAIVAGVRDWPEALRGGVEAGPKRVLLEQLISVVRPVRVARGVYKPSIELTPMGAALLDLACQGDLAPRRVAVEHMATAICSTSTHGDVLTHGAGHTDDHGAIGYVAA
jgi:DNA invertase Pin-like site-specific DNA recombinase